MKINFNKNPNGLVPAIIQDNKTRNVLMLAYMNKAAYLKTNQTKKVTFFSRSRQCLWTKGEESGNFLHLIDIKLDCDKDTLLIQVNPEGPVCHKGSDTCWQEKNEQNYGFISELEQIIEHRKNQLDGNESYVAYLFEKGINKIAQKVGEEAVEVIIEAKDNDYNLFLNESADLIFHFLILLQLKNIKFDNVVGLLEKRNAN